MSVAKCGSLLHGGGPIRGCPPHRGATGRMFESRQSSEGEEGQVEDVPWFVSLFVSWLPFIVWISAIWWIGRVVARRIEGALRAPDGRSLGDVLAEHARNATEQRAAR